MSMLLDELPFSPTSGVGVGPPPPVLGVDPQSSTTTVHRPYAFLAQAIGRPETPTAKLVMFSTVSLEVPCS